MSYDFAERIAHLRDELEELHRDIYNSNDHGAAAAVKRARRELEHPSAAVAPHAGTQRSAGRFEGADSRLADEQIVADAAALEEENEKLRLQRNKARARARAAEQDDQ